ncbi:MAG: DNA gyrase subunit A, partial [Bacteroidetes bacterium]
LFTNRGYCHWLRVHELPEAQRNQKGRHIQNLLALGPDERVIAYLNVSSLQDEAFVARHSLLFATQRGIIKKTPLLEYSRPRSKGIIALDIREGDGLVGVALLEEPAAQDVVLVSRQGQAIRFPHAEVRPMGRNAAGVMGMRLDPDDELVALVPVSQPEGYLFVLAEKGYGKATPLPEYRTTHRGGKGIRTFHVTDKTGALVAALQLVNLQEELLLVTQEGQSIRFSAQELSVRGRDTQGTLLIRVREGDRVVGVSVVRG